MTFFDAKFKQNKARYTFQCLLTTLSVLLVLLLLDAMSNVAVIAALGASSFIVFTIPHAQVSRPRFCIGGYIIGVAAGSLCYWLGYWLANIPWPDALLLAYAYADVICGALAVGLTVFGMVVTNTEHPPAASIALGLVLGEWSLKTVFVVMLGITVLSLFRFLLKPILRNLL